MEIKSNVVEIPSLEEISVSWLGECLAAHGYEHIQIDAFETVRLNMAGGDVMSPKHARRLLDAWPDIGLYNVFGPTETTIWSALKRWSVILIPVIRSPSIPNPTTSVSSENKTPRRWWPGLWWSLGNRVGVGGVTSAAHTKAMAEIISAMIAQRAQDDAGG